MFDTAVEDTLADLVKRYRAEKGESQASLGAAIEVDGQTISNIESGRTKSMKLSNLKRFSEISGIPFPVVAAAVEAGKRGHGLDEAFNELPPGVDLTNPGKAKRVPEFKSGVAATPWVDKFPEESDDFAIIDARSDGEVVLVVMGDCMSPKFHDGDRIIFSRKLALRDGTEDGRSYYIQLSDERATFKRVYVDQDDTNMYILRCWNRKKYPKDIRIHRDQVSMMLLAVSRIESINF